jgi:hypothetical protein
MSKGCKKMKKRISARFAIVRDRGPTEDRFVDLRSVGGHPNLVCVNTPGGPPVTFLQTKKSALTVDDPISTKNMCAGCTCARLSVPSSDSTVSFSMFSNNLGITTGLWFYQSKFLFHHSAVISNSVTNFGIFTSEGTAELTLRECIVQSNTAPHGTFYSYDRGKITVTNSILGSSTQGGTRSNTVIGVETATLFLENTFFSREICSADSVLGFLLYLNHEENLCGTQSRGRRPFQSSVSILLLLNSFDFLPSIIQ